MLIITALLATLATIFVGLLININIDRQNAIGQKVYGENFLVFVSMFSPILVFVGILFSKCNFF
jgi:hypothetical protein